MRGPTDARLALEPGAPATSPEHESLLAAWAADDATRAIHPTDRGVIQAMEAARSLVLDLLKTEMEASSGPPSHVRTRDLFNACARLGALMAEAGASPSLAAGTIDGAASALCELDANVAARPRFAAARASLLEGYVAAVRDAEKARARAAWDYPACVVRLEGASAAIACGHPTDDPEALTAWASRIAGRLVKHNIRAVVLGGDAVAKTELEAALELVGIAVSGGVDEATSAPTPQRRRWLRLPWRK